MSMELYFTWRFPQSIINFACAVTLLPYLLRLKISRQSVCKSFILNSTLDKTTNVEIITREARLRKGRNENDTSLLLILHVQLLYFPTY